MIFKQAQQVLDGRKRQTRRPVKPGDVGVIRSGKKPLEFASVMTGYGMRTKWQVGKTYAVQPGRSKKAVGRTPPIKVIRRERLNRITWQDAKAEDTDPYYADGKGGRYIGYYIGFAHLWDSIYRRTKWRWGKDPEVWVLEFERVKEAL